MTSTPLVCGAGGAVGAAAARPRTSACGPLPAFQAAKAWGATTIEADIVLTADGEPIPRAVPYAIKVESDRPIVVYHRAHQSRKLELRAINQATGTYYLVFSQEFVSSNAANGTTAATGSFSAYRWDGKYLETKNGKVNRREAPLGSYTLQFVVTKANELGDTSVTTETWVSPVLHITR